MEHADPTICTNCGTTFRPRGPAPRHGRRYCSKVECQRQRSKANYADRHQPESRKAPERCSRCGIRFKAQRDWRVGDELGRWCKRRACREARDLAWTEFADAEKARLLAERDVLIRVRDYLESAAQEERQDCPACGLQGAVLGYRHPTEQGQPCDELKWEFKPRLPLDDVRRAYHVMRWIAPS